MLQFSVHSQNYEKRYFGYVYDKDDGSFLIGATLIINSTSVSTSTSEFGYFQFDNILSGNYNINVSYLGFKNKTIF